MRVIVDTYNLLHLGDAHVIPDGVAGLVRLSELISESRYRGDRVLLVCDGRPPGDVRGRLAGGVRAVFSGEQTNADTVIKREVARDTGARDVVVVSSDREVQRAARRAGAKVVGSGVFLRQILSGGGTGSVGKEQRDDMSATGWMRAFGFESGESEEGEESFDPDDPETWGLEGDWWAEW